MNLGNDNTFRSVNDKGSPFRHDGNIAQVNILLADFTGLLKYKINPGFERNGIAQALLFAFLFIKLYVFFIQSIVFIL